MTELGIPVFDIEAVNWTYPIAVGFFDGINYREFIRENENDDVLWRFLSYIRDHYPGIKLYAHCASKYDNKLILASLYQHGETAIPEAGLIRLRWKETSILFEDSYLLLPMTLKVTSEMLNTSKKREWKHSKNLHPWEMGESLATFRNYLKTDCLALSEALRKLCEMFSSNFGVTPSISLSTTSVKAFSKCFFDTTQIDSNEEFEPFIREAIYGGRNEVYKRYGENINLYDVKLMYISCYDSPMPIGKMRWIKPNLDRGTLVEAKVQVPKDKYIGPLPYKLGGKLIFPTGEFTSWWDVVELRNAIEEGIDLIPRRQLECTESPILKEFGEVIGGLSLIESRVRELWKMFGIALSGKLGQGRWRDVIRHIEDIKDLQDWSPLDPDELYYTRQEYQKGRAPYIKPTIPMRVRAEARVRHYKWLKKAVEKGSIYYSDTDSIYTESSLPYSDKIGELSLIGKAERGYFIRQKLYGVVQKGRLKQKSAGYSDLKLSERDFKDLLEGKELEGEKLELSSYREIFKKGEVEILEGPSKIKGVSAENRIPDGLDTIPLHLKD